MSDTPAPAVVEAVKAAATDGRIACPVARKLAEDLGVPYKAVGDAADEAGVKVKSCDLGCFSTMPRASDIPVVSVVGKSDSGKTTLMERLIRELTDRGYRVATVKHHVHEIDIDQPGKDSWRHGRAGAVTTMISSPTQFAVVRSVERERTLDELADAAGDADILLTEGFKRAGNVRIEVARAARSDELISTPEELFALVTDDRHDVGSVPVFQLEETARLVDLIEGTFLGGGGPHGD